MLVMRSWLATRRRSHLAGKKKPSPQICRIYDQNVKNLAEAQLKVDLMGTDPERHRYDTWMRWENNLAAYRHIVTEMKKVYAL